MSNNSTHAFPDEQDALLRVARDLYLTLLDGFANLPHATVTELGTIHADTFGALPLVGIVSKPALTAAPQKKILVAAGIHGDEPAGVYALLRFLEEHRDLTAQVEIHALPCVNPFGFVTRSRAGSKRQDLNRVVQENSIAPEMRLATAWLRSNAHRYDAVFDLHEDNPAVVCDFAPEDGGPSEYYLYETTRRKKARLGEAIVSAVKAAKFPILTRAEIYREKAQNGIVRFSELTHDRYDFNRFAFETLTDTVIVSETPMSWPLEKRIAAQLIALTSGCAEVLKAN